MWNTQKLLTSKANFDAQIPSILIPIPDKQLHVWVYMLEGAVVNFPSVLKGNHVLFILIACTVHISEPV